VCRRLAKRDSRWSAIRAIAAALSKLLDETAASAKAATFQKLGWTDGHLSHGKHRWLATLAVLTVVVVAPVGEETLFRGFLFRGWHRSPRDAWPVIIVIASLWALTHVQYDLYVIAQVFAYGLVLGWFRWVTCSTILTMLLHGLINFEGTLETFMAFHA
jgi:membrane protease YdiL (CAAX protease family)